MSQIKLKKFCGTYHCKSQDSSTRLQIQLREVNEKSVLFLQLADESEGHIVDLDARIPSKIHVRHRYGLATFTLDVTENYLMEENHSDGNIVVYTKLSPELANSNRVLLKKNYSCLPNVFIEPMKSNYHYMFEVF